MSEKSDYRPRIFLKEKPFDWSQVDSDVRQIVTQFVSYLQTYPVIGASRHALLGPVGKLLSKIPLMPLTHKDLMMKEIILAHEGGGQRMMTTEAKRLAEKAVDSTIRLLGKSGVETRRGKVLEIVGDEVFARRKLDQLNYYEERGKYVITGLIKKHGNLDAINKKFQSDLEKAFKGRKVKVLSSDYISKALGEKLKGAKSILGDDILSLISEFNKTKGALEIEEGEEGPTEVTQEEIE